ncbi:MAG: tRNA lysidine(34) synthetase TilS [bacterium]
MGSSKIHSIVGRTGEVLARLGVTKTASVLVAVSGGADSMALAAILASLKKLGHIAKLSSIHINHSLRNAESDGDEALVKEYMKALKIPVASQRVNTKEYAVAQHVGIEEAARTLRYENFASHAHRTKCDFVVTAHTSNDQAETVLMNIIRGTGLNGLRGIPEHRKLTDDVAVIRPLLTIEKKELLAYIKDHSIPFREDSSNETIDFQRNKIRHLVMPKLEKAYEHRTIYSGFSKMTQNIVGVLEFIDSELLELRENLVVDKPSFFVNRLSIAFDRTKLLRTPQFLRREIILREASALTHTPFAIDQVHTDLLESYLHYPSAKSFPLGDEILISHDGKHIVIEQIQSPPQLIHELAFGKPIRTPVGMIFAKKVLSWNKPKNAEVAYFSYHQLKSRKLHIRYWHPGDKIQPFGMKGKSRLVSDILSEAGIKSERLKYFVPLVVFQEEPDLILWIPGIRSAEIGRLGSESETAVELRRKMA